MDQFSFISWLGHASFSLKDEKTGKVLYYIDPYHLPKVELEPADLIFITHAHQDHFSPSDIKKLLKLETVIVGPKDCIPEEFSQKNLVVIPNQDYETHEIMFSTIPAYNLKPERLSFHPKKNNWVGYVFNISGMKIYHAGDTDFIPEMNELKKQNLDLALLPIGGTYTMDTEEAADAANAICAKYTAPMHYKALLGESAEKEEKKFKSLVSNSKVLFFNELR